MRGTWWIPESCMEEVTFKVGVAEGMGVCSVERCFQSSKRHPPPLPNLDPSKPRAPISQTTGLAPVAGRSYSVPSLACVLSVSCILAHFPDTSVDSWGWDRLCGRRVPGSVAHTVRTHHCVTRDPVRPFAQHSIEFCNGALD